MKSESMEMNRRSLVRGGAWATPLVLSTSIIPVYAASGETCQNGSFMAPAPSDENSTTTSWVVPEGIKSVCFTVLGGAGGPGGTTTAPQTGGAGAQVTGVLTVSPGDTLTLIVGAGGTNGRRGSQQYGTENVVGGRGYGNGGDSAAGILSGNNVPSGDNVVVQRIGGSGGGGSAILLNGQPVVIAGGGGGGGNSPTFAGVWPAGATWKGAPAGSTNANNNNPSASSTTSTQLAGSGGGTNADATGVYTRTNTSVAALPNATYTFGGGAGAGVAGNGGQPGSDTGSSNDNAYVLTKKFIAGNPGGSVAAPGPADGGSATAIDTTYSYVSSKSARAINVGGGGGGGYGGGGSGSGTSYAGTYKESTGVSYYFGMLLSAAGPGAAGGSYTATSVVTDGVITEGSNSNNTPGIRNPGSISFSY